MLRLIRHICEIVFKFFKKAWESEWTKTYRPLEDWDISPHEMLNLLPPEAFDPPTRGR